MSKLFIEMSKHKISILKEDTFQEFIDTLYIIMHKHNYTPIKGKRDKGSDGFLNKKCVIAVYAPENYTLSKFKGKVAGDFDKYKKNFISKYPEWMFIYNGEITTEMHEAILEVNNKTLIKSQKHLLDEIDDLNWDDKKKLGEYLGIDEEYYTNDIIEEILDDMLKVKIDEEQQIEYSKPNYIEDKIKKNFPSSDVDAINSEYESLLPYFQSLKNLLTLYDDDKIRDLKSRVISDYTKYKGKADKKIIELTVEYSRKYKNDDTYKKYVRVIIIYFFEQCIIGEKVEEENDRSSS